MLYTIYVWGKPWHDKGRFGIMEVSVSVGRKKTPKNLNYVNVIIPKRSPLSFLRWVWSLLLMPSKLPRP